MTIKISYLLVPILLITSSLNVSYAYAPTSISQLSAPISRDALPATVDHILGNLFNKDSYLGFYDESKLIEYFRKNPDDIRSKKKILYLITNNKTNPNINRLISVIGSAALIDDQLEAEIFLLNLFKETTIPEITFSILNTVSLLKLPQFYETVHKEILTNIETFNLRDKKQRLLLTAFISLSSDSENKMNTLKPIIERIINRTPLSQINRLSRILKNYTSELEENQYQDFMKTFYINIEKPLNGLGSIKFLDIAAKITRSYDFIYHAKLKEYLLYPEESLIHQYAHINSLYFEFKWNDSLNEKYEALYRQIKEPFLKARFLEGFSQVKSRLVEDWSITNGTVDEFISFNHINQTALASLIPYFYSPINISYIMLKIADNENSIPFELDELFALNKKLDNIHLPILYRHFRLRFLSIEGNQDYSTTSLKVLNEILKTNHLKNQRNLMNILVRRNGEISSLLLQHTEELANQNYKFLEEYLIEKHTTNFFPSADYDDFIKLLRDLNTQEINNFLDGLKREKMSSSKTNYFMTEFKNATTNRNINLANLFLKNEGNLIQYNFNFLNDYIALKNNQQVITYSQLDSIKEYLNKFNYDEMNNLIEMLKNGKFTSRKVNILFNLLEPLEIDFQKLANEIDLSSIDYIIQYCLSNIYSDTKTSLANTLKQSNIPFQINLFYNHVDILYEHSQDVRSLYLDLIEKFGNYKAQEHLMRYLHTESNPWIVEQAANVIENFVTPYNRHLLARFFKQKDIDNVHYNIRIKLLNAITTSIKKWPIKNDNRDYELVSAILPFLESPHGNIRRPVIDLLSTIGESNKQLAEFILDQSQNALLNDHNEIRNDVANLITRLPSITSKKPIISFILSRFEESIEALKNEPIPHVLELSNLSQALFKFLENEDLKDYKEEIQKIKKLFYDANFVYLNYFYQPSGTNSTFDNEKLKKHGSIISEFMFYILLIHSPVNEARELYTTFYYNSKNFKGPKEIFNLDKDNYLKLKQTGMVLLSQRKDAESFLDLFPKKISGRHDHGIVEIFFNGKPRNELFLNKARDILWVKNERPFTYFILFNLFIQNKISIEQLNQYLDHHINSDNFEKGTYTALVTTLSKLISLWNADDNNEPYLKESVEKIIQLLASKRTGYEFLETLINDSLIISFRKKHDLTKHPQNRYFNMNVGKIPQDLLDSIKTIIYKLDSEYITYTSA